MGLAPSLFFGAIEGGTLDLPYLRMKGKAIAEREFEPSFRLALAAKDAGLVRKAAERRGMDLPLVRAVQARLFQATNASTRSISAVAWPTGTSAAQGR